MTPRIEKTVFISYRRTNLPWALAIFQNLKSEGYDVFFDYLSRSRKTPPVQKGSFSSVLLTHRVQTAVAKIGVRCQ